MKSSRVHAMGEPSDRPRSAVSGISKRTDVEHGKGRSRMNLIGRIIACCQHSGEKMQMTKMLILTIIPTVALIVMCIVDVTAVSDKSVSSNQIKDMVTLSTEIGKFIHFLQRERGFSSLFVTAENQTRTLIKTILLGSYKSTFELLDKLSKWPSETKTKFEKYPTKQILRQYIDDHRVSVLNGFGQSAETGMREELNFYNNIVMVFINWLYEAIQFSQQGDDWRMLVAYQLLLISKNDMGIERTLGSIFFMRGHFDDFHDYQWYLREKSMGAGNFEASTLFSPTVANLFNQKKIDDRDNVTYFIEILREEISLNRRVTGSLPRSFEWFQLMSGYLDIMFNVQLALADIILESVNRNLAQHTKSITISALILCVVLIICPLIIISVKALVAEIQQFAASLADQTEKLSKERLRTESLLYQMLPRPVADQLKLNKTVDAETFEEVTIFFSDIVGFTSISAQCSPMEVVGLLNTLYLCFDTRLELYDVYKVETIGDAYMVASGVPNRNGRLHVAEVATMALDLSHHVTHLEIPHLPDTLLRLRAGIHTGPVVAGVVGSKMPRYCLFGDSVNTASRMESTGQADRIQLSWITQASLQQTPGFSTIKRGLVEVKGKGNMETYWLMQKVGFEESLPCMPNCRKLSDAETRRISQNNA